MTRGKETCRILKDIRRQIAEANDIEYITSECQFKGECLGTCPKCEAEVRYLEQQLNSRRLSGKSIVIAGISASALAMTIPLTSVAQIQQESTFMNSDTINTTNTISENNDDVFLDGELGQIIYVVPKKGYVELNIIDENRNSIYPENIYAKKISFDANGKEKAEELKLFFNERKNNYRLYWDKENNLLDMEGEPIDKAVIRIGIKDKEEQKTITVRRPKRHYRKTVRL